MAKFIYLYRGPAPDLTPEQATDRIAAFGAWMEKVGTALVDIGSPFGASTSIRDDGTEGSAGDLIGYTIVDADALPAAKAPTTASRFSRAVMRDAGWRSSNCRRCRKKIARIVVPRRRRSERSPDGELHAAPLLILRRCRHRPRATRLDGRRAATRDPLAGWWASPASLVARASWSWRRQSRNARLAGARKRLHDVNDGRGGG